MTNFSTPQEEFWAGDFGNDYIRRNIGEDVVNSNLVLFRNILQRATDVKTILELGCNVGLNLEALKRIDRDFSLTGYEINEEAVRLARAKGVADIVQGTIVEDLNTDRTYDLTFTKTVLIHVNPERLASVYDNLYRLSTRFVMVCEYYNPSPVVVNYRGHADRLFKRDFAGELMDRFDLRLVDYGFAYHRDNDFRHQDDVTWFLLEK